jgi:hypothetical protein
MIEYCTATNPAGPWNIKVLYRKRAQQFYYTSGIIDYKGKSYFFYHNGSLPTGEVTGAPFAWTTCTISRWHHSKNYSNNRRVKAVQMNKTKKKKAKRN